MRFVQGRCAKCSNPMSMIRGNYGEYWLRLESGDLFVLGVCAECVITELDFPEISEAIQFLFSTYSKKPYLNVVAIAEHKNIQDVRDELQAGTCHKCGVTLGDHYTVTNGVAIHDPCPRDVVKSEAEVLAETVQSIPNARPRRVGPNQTYAKRV